MSRFLIRPMVHCRNLASLVLGMVLRRFGQDFEARYGLTPWLVESFNDAEAFAGTCYQATNWVKVGLTQGRGRQDRHWHAPVSVKENYVYPLRPDFREADFFELFDEQRQGRRADLLVRAKHDRAMGGGQGLFDLVRQSPAQGRLQVPVPRQSARPKKSGQKAREARPQRLAEVSLRYRQITLPADGINCLPGLCLG